MPVDPQQANDFAYINALLYTLQRTALDFYLSGNPNNPRVPADPNDRHNRALAIVDSLLTMTGVLMLRAPNPAGPLYGCFPPTECIDGVCTIIGAGLPAEKPRP